MNCVHSLLAAIALLFLIGCVATEENEGPASYYRPAGWLEAENFTEADEFTAYRLSVTQIVNTHRYIIEDARRSEEVTLVSPAEFAPDDRNCDADVPRGIVILVHGLSDTAFAMRDLAKALATQCYLTRTLLLPGHGTVPGDLLAVDHDDWLDSVRVAVNQAKLESESVALIGFSLGAVLGMSVALEPDQSLDALISISPAFYLSSWRLARWAPWVHRVRPWIDRELPDDRFRYEAMPTRGVAETVRAVRDMRRRLTDAPSGIKIPWMLVQSMDDAVVEPALNLSFFVKQANAPGSRALLFASTPETDTRDDVRVLVLPGNDDNTRVLGLTHVAVHTSPRNRHYGIDGEYRNCGSTGGREASSVYRCEAAAHGEFDYGLWNTVEDAEVAIARSTFNPHFDHLVDAIVEFLNATNASPAPSTKSTG